MAEQMTDMNIEDLYDAHTPESGGGLFLKFEDDKEVRVRLLSEPYIFASRYEDKKTGEVTNTKKYAWIVANRNEDNKAQIMQLPAGGYELIANLVKDDDFGNPNEYDMKITRKNTNGRFSYMVQGSPKRSPITEEELEEMVKIDVVEQLSRNNPQVMSLRNYLKAGSKFPNEGAKLEADGTPVITDLDNKNPLDSL